MPITLAIEDTHPAHRPNGAEAMRLEAGNLMMRAINAGKSVLVLRSSQALSIVSALGTDAVLRPGWDGTLGYSLYALELMVPVPGNIHVQLVQAVPHTTPVTTTAEQHALFESALEQRASRFPDEIRAFRQWQAVYKRKLIDAFLGGSLPNQLPLESRILETKEYPSFKLIRISYRSRTDRTNDLLLSLPKATTRAPLLLALHGHEADWGKAVEEAYRAGHIDDFCAAFAESGWAVLQPATMDHHLHKREWTLLGERTWDAMVAIDVAATFSEVDMQRVAVCGLSTGAHHAMNMLALDDRIQAGIVGCILSTWNHIRTRLRFPPHCDCGVMGQLSPHMELCDWAALSCPKPVQYQQGLADACFCPGSDPALLDLEWNNGILPTREYDFMFTELRRAYRMSGAPNHLDSHIHSGPHKVDNEAALSWLNCWVKDRK